MKNTNGSIRISSGQVWVRVALALAIALQLAFGSFAGISQAAETNETATDKPAAVGPARADIQAALKELRAAALKTKPLSDWSAFSLARSGPFVADEYLPLAASSVGELKLVTDYARVALAVNANGGDARKVGGVDLLSKIAGFDKMAAQGPNAPAFALLALNAADYKPGAQDRWTTDALVKWLVDNRNTDGGWSLKAGKSDVDVTAIVLSALAVYKDREDVKPVVEQALLWLSAEQNANGGFGAANESSESTAQVLIALAALDLDPANDTRFVKAGKSALARLLAFRTSDGQFAHTIGGKADSIASFNALLAVTAVDRWQDGLPGLYAGIRTADPVDVVVNGPEGTLVQDTAYGRTAMDSLLQVLKQHKIDYTVTRHPQYGAYLTAIGGFASGKFGGYDGWQYAVKQNSEWADNLPGISSYTAAGGQLVVYYGGETALIHSIKVTTTKLRATLPIDVIVEQETYDWNTGSKTIAPAVGARVTLDGRSVVTDTYGKAALQTAKTGDLALTVDGYRTAAVPQYVAAAVTLHVNPYAQAVKVRVEGDQGAIASGAAKGGTALEALESFLKAGGIQYEVKDSSFGKYLTSIKGIAAGKYGGYDGWLYAVKADNQWMIPAEGIGSFLLDEGQELVVYYGDGTKLVDPLVLTPAAPKPGEAFTVKATNRELDWNTGKLLDPAPIAGAAVTIGATTVTTDAYGIASFTGLPDGLYNLQISGYAADKAPSVLRDAQQLSIVGVYPDGSAISAWALDAVNKVRAAGALLGVNDSIAAAFQPKASVSRAEFVAALARALGLQPATHAGEAFTDVAADAWYAKDLLAAKQAGIAAGVAPGKFSPDGKLTREQAALLLSRALKLKEADASVAALIKDVAQVAPSALSAVQAVYALGYMTGDPLGRFMPKGPLTREQTAVIISRVISELGVK